MNLLPLLAGWVVLAVVVIVLITYRKSVSNREDDTLHIGDMEQSALAQQTVVARKLEVIDKWGKIITGITVVYGLALGGYYVYLTWIHAAESSLRMSP